MKFFWFHMSLLYGLYFEFYSLRVLYIYYSTKRALRAQVLYVLRCQRVLRASVPCMLSCSRDNVSYVPSCLCVPTRSCAITSNMKNIKFSMTCFSFIFGIFSLSFSCEIKLYLKNPRQAGMSPIFFFFFNFF